MVSFCFENEFDDAFFENKHLEDLSLNLDKNVPAHHPHVLYEGCPIRGLIYCSKDYTKDARVLKVDSDQPAQHGVNTLQLVSKLHDAE